MNLIKNIFITLMFLLLLTGCVEDLTGYSDKCVDITSIGYYDVNFRLRIRIEHALKTMQFQWYSNDPMVATGKCEDMNNNTGTFDTSGIHIVINGSTTRLGNIETSIVDCEFY